jgi:hypothetical protein
MPRSSIDPLVIDIVRNCRNAKLHVLVLLWGATTPVTALDIANAGLMNRDTAGDHLKKLEDDGYATHQGQRWFLTNKGRQLPLPGLTLDQNSENFRTFSSSSSYPTTNIIPPALQKPLQLPGETRKNSALSPEYELLVPFFLEKIGPSKNIASWINQAAESDDSPSKIASLIAQWAVYLSTDKAKGITNPGAFVGKQIVAGNAPPAWFGQWLREHGGGSLWTNGTWSAWLRENGVCVQCGCEPCACAEERA